MKRTALASLFFPLSVSLSACGGDSTPAIVGEWQSSAPVGALGVNTLSVRDSLRGEALVRFYIGDTGYHLSYSVRCELDGDGSICDFVCSDSDCSDWSFVMTCADDDARMSCTADRNFENYDFEWVKQD
jgi:hypothetical protein